MLFVICLVLMEWNWVISKQIIDQSTSFAAFKNSCSSANYSTSIWFTSFIQMLCINEQWWKSQQLGKWLVFPLASVVPLVPQLPFSVCWLQVCCWCRLALQGCCASMAHSWESFSFLSLFCHLLTAPMLAFVHALARWIEGLNLFTSWCVVQD